MGLGPYHSGERSLGDDRLLDLWILRDLIVAPLRWISERRNAFLADREMRDRVEGDLLPGLNALRAIAALMVVLGHVELLKSQRGIPSAFNTPGSWLPDGHLGVVLFFALSGYLITFLLVKERAAIGRTDLRKFYMRRILRIWPLYYTVLLLSVVPLPRQHRAPGG